MLTLIKNKRKQTYLLCLGFSMVLNIFLLKTVRPIRPSTLNLSFFEKSYSSNYGQFKVHMFSNPGLTPPQVIQNKLIPDLQKLPKKEKLPSLKKAPKLKTASSSPAEVFSFKEFIKVYKHPSYPKLALMRRIEGEVTLELFINKKGHLDRVSLKKKSGNSLLDKAALKAARNWKFKPFEIYKRDSIRVTKIIRFQIKQKREN